MSVENFCNYRSHIHPKQKCLDIIGAVGHVSYGHIYTNFVGIRVRECLNFFDAALPIEPNDYKGSAWPQVPLKYCTPFVVIDASPVHVGTPIRMSEFGRYYTEPGDVTRGDLREGELNWAPGNGVKVTIITNDGRLLMRVIRFRDIGIYTGDDSSNNNVDNADRSKFWITLDSKTI